MRYAATVANNINCLLDGASDPDPEEFGHTTEEERSLSGCVQVKGSILSFTNCVFLVAEYSQ